MNKKLIATIIALGLIGTTTGIKLNAQAKRQEAEIQEQQRLERVRQEEIRLAEEKKRKEYNAIIDGIYIDAVDSVDVEHSLYSLRHKGELNDSFDNASMRCGRGKSYSNCERAIEKLRKDASKYKYRMNQFAVHGMTQAEFQDECIRKVRRWTRAYDNDLKNPGRALDKGNTLVTYKTVFVEEDYGRKVEEKYRCSKEGRNDIYLENVTHMFR